MLVSSELILSEKNSTEERLKRHHNEFHLHPPQSRRLNDGKTYSAVYNKLQPLNPASHSRLRHPSRSKPLHIPPYAVKMEPLVQYSQRDPLYHDKDPSFNVSTTSDLDKHSKVDHFSDTANNFIDYSPHFGLPPPPPPPPLPAGYDAAPSVSHFYKEPEPIIEIIIKESNETLPPQPIPTLPSTTTTKEPIQVFYVKYKKNRTHTGKEEVIYEEPVPALTPLSTDIVENSHPTTESYYPSLAFPNPVPPSTTYRTIIRPDSEIYHGTGLKVTFGNQEESYPQSSTFEHKTYEAQKRDSVEHNDTQVDLKSVASNRDTKISSKHVLENRQSQSEYIRFANYKPEPTPSSHNIQLRQNQLAQNTIRPSQNLQPLQIEDGSFEQPPPPSYLHQNHPQQNLIFPSSQPNIPFRLQHALNFQQYQPFQNTDFSQPDLSLLQRQTQNHLPLLHQNPQIHSALPNTKLYPHVTQAVLNPYYISQNQEYVNPDKSFSPQLINSNTNLQTQLQNDAVRFSNPGRQNLINLNSEFQQQQAKGNHNIQPSPNEVNNINYNSQLFQNLQNTPFGGNEFLQQPYSNQQKVQNQQGQTYQQQQLNTIERQKQLHFEKVRQQLAINQKIPHRRPADNEKYPISSDYVNQFAQTEKTSESTSQSTNIQPNYRNIIPASQHRQTPKEQNHFPINEITTVSAIQDGEIYKSISQSEEHQILNADQFGSKQNQQQYKQNVNQENSPQSDASNFKPPKQVFETGHRNIYHTSTPKTTSARNEQANTSKFESQQGNTEKEGYNKRTEFQSNNKEKDDKSKSNLTSQLAALPAEVPDDLREQLLSSGILNNADIQILDYDKVGDIPIENLPPEALENLYGAGSAPVPSVAFANASKSVEMKVVRYDPDTFAGQNISNSYVQEDSTEVDPVVLNDSSYNRYLPLKVKGSQFPIPDTPLLKNKKISSVVILAPVDYDYVQTEAERQGKKVPQVHGVRFVSGESLKTLVKNPSEFNFINWIEKERETPANKQSVILLVSK